MSKKRLAGHLQLCRLKLNVRRALHTKRTGRTRETARPTVRGILQLRAENATESFRLQREEAAGAGAVAMCAAAYVTPFVAAETFTTLTK